MPREKRGPVDSALRILAATSLLIAGLVLLGAVIGVAALFTQWGLMAAETHAEIRLPEILLAAASLFILVFSVLVALGAVFGWRALREVTAQQVREEVEEDLEEMNVEHKLLLNSTRAFIYQDLSYEKYAPDQVGPTIRVTQPRLLDQAIQTYDAVLQSTPSDHDKIGQTKNNLVFLLAVRGEEKDGPRARQLASELRDHYSAWNDAGVLNTYARVVAIFHDSFEEPRRELSRAHEALRWVVGNNEVSAEERKNARRHLKEVRRAIQRL